MHIRALSISNFRGIRHVDLSGLDAMVIIAGQNGSGKSCVFDAIRLLKSVYGGYQQNEIHQWMGEFQVDLFRNNFVSMLNDPTKGLHITCDFSLSNEERSYLTDNADELLRESIWRSVVPEAYQWSSAYGSTLMPQYREKEGEVRARVELQLPVLKRELDLPVIRGAFHAHVAQQASYEQSQVLSVVFSLFRPEKLGVIDYHGAQRHYGREAVQGVNLNLDANAQQRSQSALYNYGAKYSNVKSEMAASYIKDILAGQALGVGDDAAPTLTGTLKELFATFFPDKEFLGPKPTPQGALEFPVKTSNGSVHDLDELSAGEKEILYGYLRIRNSAPKNSIILLDEPELHLNPRLVRSLPAFYRKHLGEALGNQIWLVTHSDALMREVVGSSGYDVFHMLPCGSGSVDENQLRKLSLSSDIDAIVADLVGDLASYHPGGKVVILEGGGDSEFDQRVVSNLFPELQQRVNLISGTNKVRVQALHETLSALAERGALPMRFYAITDSDSDIGQSSGGVGRYQWEVYHIENYFMSPSHIRAVMRALGQDTFDSDAAVLDGLRDCAEERLPKLVRLELASYANQALVGAIDTRCDPGTATVQPLSDAIARSRDRLNEVSSEMLGARPLAEKASDIERRYRTSLEDGSWVRIFPGRDILKSFVHKHVSGVQYERFRNLILSRMRDESHQPDGMKTIIHEILNDESAMTGGTV